MTEDTNELLERIREILNEGPLSDSQASAIRGLIIKRAKMLEKHTSSLLNAMAKYERNPQKYLPQLANAKQDAHSCRQLSKVLINLIEKLEGMHR
jgi:hypothetical protein